MSETIVPWKWSPKRRKAAELIAKGELNNTEIATECGVSARSLYKWRRAPEFDVYVKELEEAIKGEAKRFLFRHALAAAQRLVDLAESGKLSDKIRLQATIEVLNRSGVITVSAIELDNKGQPLVALLPAVERNENSVDAP